MAGETTSSGSSGASTERKQDPRYPIEWHQDRARRLYGANAHAVAGALSSERAQTFTEAKVKGLVKDFLQHEDTSQPAQPDPEPIEAEEG